MNKSLVECATALVTPVLTNALVIIDRLLGGQVREVTELGLVNLFLSKEDTSLMTSNGPEFVSSMNMVFHPVKHIKVKGKQLKTNATISGVSIVSALKLARALYEVYYDSLPNIARLPLLEQLVIFFEIREWLPLDFVANAKYVLAWPMAKYLRNDLPACPASFTSGNPLLFRGRIKQMLKNRLVAENDRSLRLWAGILQGVKRAANEVPEMYIQLALEKHKIALTTPVIVDSTDLTMSSQFYNKVFSKFQPPRPRLLEASTSASFESANSQGGAREHIRQYLATGAEDVINDVGRWDNKLHPRNRIPKTVHFRSFIHELDGMMVDNEVVSSVDALFGHSLTPLDIIKGVSSFLKDPSEVESMLNRTDRPTKSDYSGLGKQRSKGTSDERNDFYLSRQFAVERSHELLSMVETRPGVVETFRGLPKPGFRQMVNEALASHASVAVHPILEPLKVRLISKGSSLRYYLSRFFQKGLWSHLKKFPQFVLTNRVVGPIDFHDLLDREKKIGLGKEFDKWVSGDYSAATDNLKIHYTKAAFEAALEKCTSMDYDVDVKDVLRSVLYEQELTYPGNSHIDPAMQVTGQLMGSTLSFPILCIVNLVCYWRALEEYLGRSIELQDLPVLINGDDILFRTSPAFYVVWRRLIAEAGFTLSLGKNYVHKNILTVNSQLFRHVKLVDGSSSFKILGYLNVGLLVGQSKVSRGDKDSRIKPIWDNHNTVIAGAVDPIRAHHRFVHYNMDVIREYTTIQPGTTANLFLPFLRGGLGFDVPAGLDFRITSFQRKFATYLWTEAKRLLDTGEDLSSSLGLVQTRKTLKVKLPVLYHVPNKLQLLKVNDVLNANEKVYVPPSFNPPALSLSVDPRRPELLVRKPSALVLDRFRNTKCKRMSSKEILTWDYVVVEQSEVIPVPP